jgi:thioredoxin reductase (NADPH)
MPENVYDVIIIGGGPGGFTAGLYASRANLNVLLLEGASSMSQIAFSEQVENYPGFPEGIGGADLMERLRNQAVKFGTKTVMADVASLSKIDLSSPDGRQMDGWQVTAGSETYRTLAVIVATGASWRKLGVSGEEQFVGRGISFCATCDAPFFRDQEVAVVGGGDTAVQEAIYLTNFAKKVTLIHRRNRLRASGILKDRALANGKIEFAWNSVVDEIRGGDSVHTVVIKDVGRPDKKRELSVSGIFLFIGLIPNTAFLRGLVGLDPNGYILADSGMKTSAKGIFACGDCRNTPLRQVVTACGDGAIAAVASQLYVEDLKGEAY